MIPRILIIVGAILILFGIIGIIALLILPIRENFEIVLGREYDFIRSRLDPNIRRFVAFKKGRLIKEIITAITVGSLMFFAGLYLGFSAEGEGFWFYKQFYSQEVSSQNWDAINEKGQFVAEDGKVYSYYILMSGKEIVFSGENCEGLEDLKRKLSRIRRENTVILIDSFAAASTYHAVEDMLNELGIEYEETN